MSLDKFARSFIYTGLATTFLSAGLLLSDVHYAKGRINEGLSRELYQEISPRYENHASVGIAGLGLIAIGGWGNIISKLRRMKRLEGLK